MLACWHVAQRVRSPQTMGLLCMRQEDRACTYSLIMAHGGWRAGRGARPRARLQRERVSERAWSEGRGFVGPRSDNLEASQLIGME